MVNLNYDEDIEKEDVGKFRLVLEQEKSNSVGCDKTSEILKIPSAALHRTPIFSSLSSDGLKNVGNREKSPILSPRESSEGKNFDDEVSRIKSKRKKKSLTKDTKDEINSSEDDISVSPRLIESKKYSDSKEEYNNNRPSSRNMNDRNDYRRRNFKDRSPSFEKDDLFKDNSYHHKSFRSPQCHRKTRDHDLGPRSFSHIEKPPRNDYRTGADGRREYYHRDDPRTKSPRRSEIDRLDGNDLSNTSRRNYRNRNEAKDRNCYEPLIEDEKRYRDKGRRIDDRKIDSKEKTKMTEEDEINKSVRRRSNSEEDRRSYYGKERPRNLDERDYRNNNNKYSDKSLPNRSYNRDHKKDHRRSHRNEGLPPLPQDARGGERRRRRDPVGGEGSSRVDPRDGSPGNRVSPRPESVMSHLTSASVRTHSASIYGKHLQFLRYHFLHAFFSFDKNNIHCGILFLYHAPIKPRVGQPEKLLRIEPKTFNYRISK